jgi:hypothetical protein
MEGHGGPQECGLVPIAGQLTERLIEMAMGRAFSHRGRSEEQSRASWAHT